MNKKDTIYYEPFGRPMASQMTNDEIQETFFNMPNMDFPIYSGSFVYTSRRGGGKTHLLKKKYIELKEEIPPPLIDYEGTSISTEHFLKTAKKYEELELTAHLTSIWEMVLALRVAGLFLSAIQQGYGNLESHVARQYIEDLTDWIKKANIISIEETKDKTKVIIAIEASKNTSAIYHTLINKSSNRHYWENEFLPSFNRRELIEYLKKVNLTAYLFIDDTDDSYHESPSFWNINLWALYRATMFLKKELPSVHVITAIRREIYDHIQHNDPNWTRYAGSDNIKDIIWDGELLRLFFEKKIERFPREIRLFEKEKESLNEQFLGVKTIINKYNIYKVKEEVFQYILRHTFYRARDIIYMGNEIWRQLRDLKGIKNISTEDTDDLETAISEGVVQAAKKIAQELISECNDVIKDLTVIPRNISPTIYLLQILQKNILTREELMKAHKNLENDHPEIAKIHPYCILTRWGLIGWASKDLKNPPNLIQKFNYESSPNEPKIINLPQSDFYFIHPALYDLPEIHNSLKLNNKIIVGHDRNFPFEKYMQETKQQKYKIKFIAKPQFQLDWVEPYLIDRNGKHIYLSLNQHGVLKLFFEVPNIRTVSYKAIVERFKDTPSHEIDDRSDYESQAYHQFARALRRDLKQYGISDQNAIIKNIKGKGYTLGNAWYRKRPVINKAVALYSASEDLYESDDWRIKKKPRNRRKRDNEE